MKSMTMKRLFIQTLVIAVIMAIVFEEAEAMGLFKKKKALLKKKMLLPKMKKVGKMAFKKGLKKGLKKAPLGKKKIVGGVLPMGGGNGGQSPSRQEPANRNEGPTRAAPDESQPWSRGEEMYGAPEYAPVEREQEVERQHEPQREQGGGGKPKMMAKKKPMKKKPKKKFGLKKLFG